MCLERVAEVATRIESELAKAIVGQRRVVREIPVTSETGMSPEVPLLVESRARHARPSVLQSIPELTGGIRVRADDLDPLVRHFRSLPRTTHSVAMHPMRSGWWMVPFAAILCVEWALRRLGGLR